MLLVVGVAIIFLIMTVQVHPVDAFTTTAASYPSSNNSSKKTIVDNNVAANTNHNDPFRLGYVTDVEGNIDYFLNYVVNHSQVLKIQYWDTKTLTLAFQQNNDNYYFVYGGDAVDKGPGDVRLVRALVDLKHRYPDRVYLLVGNRDLNKLRLVAELAEDDLQRRKIEEIPPPHWDPNAPSLYEYLTEVAAKENIDLATANTRVNRLHYMLIHTLGCPNTFEFRREELSILRENKSITDDEVVDSFRSEIEGEGGSLFDYLSLGTVAVVIGNTLFCHGAVDRHTMGYVPPLNSKFENPKAPPQGRYIDNVVEWTEALNDYLQKGLDDFRKRPYWNKERTSRGGEALMALQNRSAMWGRSIISNCYGDGGCITTAHAAELRKKQVPAIITDPLVFENISSDPLDPVVSNWLLKSGIQRVIVGHKPTGDSPAVLSSDYTGGVEIVSADTSFSDTSYADNRGQAVSVVEVVGATENESKQSIAFAWHSTNGSDV